MIINFIVRAKRTDNGEWVEGFLFQLAVEGGFEWCIEREPLAPNDYSELSGLNSDWFFIDEKTICPHVNIDNQYFQVNDIYKWVDYNGKITGVIRFGEYEQDGSGGEYSASKCIGFYVDVIDVEPLDGLDETKEEAEKYYPEYLRSFSLCRLLNDSSINNLKLVGNIFDNAELMQKE